MSFVLQLPEQMDELKKNWGNRRVLDIYYMWNFPHVAEVDD